MLSQLLIGLFALALFSLCGFSVGFYFTGQKEPSQWKGKIIKYIAIGTVSVILLTVAFTGAIVTGTVLLHQIGY